MKPNYCTRPDVPECVFCGLVNYGLDCANNPIPRSAEQPSKRLQVYDQVYNALSQFVPSEKIPHLDALQAAGLLEILTVEQCAVIVKIAQAAYWAGQASQGAEKIDNDAVWLKGVGGLERQPDGSWKLTMPDEPGAVAASVAGARLGSIKSERKADASRENGRKGGRPRKQK